MSINIISSNSGTTFLRGGGVNKIKIKSNLAWRFTLLPLNPENDINAVGIETTIEDGEMISTLTGTGTNELSIRWINIVDNLGIRSKTITGKGTTYLEILAEENFIGQDMFAVGYAEAISEPGICDYTVFEQYGDNYYFIDFDNDEQDVHTPSEVAFDAVEIPVEIYTNSKCIVTIENIAGQEYSIGSGVTKTGVKSDIEVPDFVFSFVIPENNTPNDIVYTLRAQSREDETVVKYYFVTQKTQRRRIKLTTNLIPQLSSSEEIFVINSDVTKFTINYQITPPTMVADLFVFSGAINGGNYKLLQTTNGCNGNGAITYECGENPNKGSSSEIDKCIEYRISGCSTGETWSVTGGTSTYVVESDNGYAEDNPKFSKYVIIRQIPEEYFFELIYGTQVGNSVNVYGVDGDSGGSYIVRVHSNYPYDGFVVEKRQEDTFINDVTKVYEGEDGFNVLFNVRINEQTVNNDGIITVKYIENNTVIETGTIVVKQNASTSYEFKWVSDVGSGVGTASATKTVNADVSSTYMTFSSTYPGNNLGVTVSESGGFITGANILGNTLTVYFNTGSTQIRTGTVVVKYGNEEVGYCTITQIPNTFYVFSGFINVKYDDTDDYTPVTSVTMTKVIVDNNTLGTVCSTDMNTPIYKDSATRIDFSTAIGNKYGAWTDNTFILQINFNINTDPASATPSSVDTSVPSGTGTVTVDLNFRNSPNVDPIVIHTKGYWHN